ncbi:MAG: preprotein translocase subunit YajC [Bacteroidota bacterium]
MESLGQFGQLLPFLLIIVVMYFMMIRPQQKKAKLEKEFEKALKTGDKIITKSGIHGKIAEISEDSVVIETMAGKLKMERSAISLELSQKVNKK